MSVVLCLPAPLRVSTAASRGQAPHGTASLVLPVDVVLPRLHNNPDAGYSHACGVLPTALSTARTLDAS